MASPEFLTLQTALAGRYLLERELGRGGMSIVFLARDLALERPVAVKLLPPLLAENPELRGRFLQEARTAARLSHPHIVAIHAVEELGSMVCFMMAYIPGPTLAERVRAEGPLPALEVARIVREIAWALAYAHQQGVVHRDVKAENILLERGSGRAMITDFGIAQIESTGGVRTPAGSLRGTVRYMSPEQSRGDPLDGRSDLYSLGLTAFLALTGRLPFESEQGAALLLLKSTEAPPPVALLRRDAPSPLAAAIDRCLALAPADRFPTAEALAEAIGQVHALEATPAVLQKLVREITGIGVDIGGFASLALVAILVQSVTRDFLGFGFFYTLGLCSLMLGLTSIRGLGAFRLIREAARDGWELGDVEAAARREIPRLAGPTSSITPAARTGLWALMIAAAVGLWLGPREWIQLDSHWILTAIAEMLCLAAPLAAGRWLAAGLEQRKDGKLGPFTRFFFRFKGGWLFRLAGLGKGSAERPTALADQPTELLLADQARELLRALPAASRERVKDAATLVEKLFNDAAGQRRRLEEIDQALAAVGPAGPADREAAREEIAKARGAAVGRLGLTIQALEQLRLELLRASAAAGGEGLTEDLALLARLSERLDSGE